MEAERQQEAHSLQLILGSKQAPLTTHADQTRVGNNAVLSGVACGQPIAPGKITVKHAQLVKARRMIAKQCKTTDYAPDRLKEITPHAQGSDEFTELVRTVSTNIRQDSAKLHRAYIMLFSQPSMVTNKVGCRTTQMKNRNMKGDYDTTAQAGNADSVVKKKRPRGRVPNNCERDSDAAEWKKIKLSTEGDDKDDED